MNIKTMEITQLLGVIKMTQLNKDTVMLQNESVLKHYLGNPSTALNSRNYIETHKMHVVANLKDIKTKCESVVNIGLQFGINGLTVYHGDYIQRANPQHQCRFRGHSWAFATLDCAIEQDLELFAEDLIAKLLLIEIPFDNNNTLAA